MKMTTTQTLVIVLALTCLVSELTALPRIHFGSKLHRQQPSIEESQDNTSNEVPSLHRSGETLKSILNPSAKRFKRTISK